MAYLASINVAWPASYLCGLGGWPRRNVAQRRGGLGSHQPVSLCGQPQQYGQRICVWPLCIRNDSIFNIGSSLYYQYVW